MLSCGAWSETSLISTGWEKRTRFYSHRDQTVCLAVFAKWIGKYPRSPPYITNYEFRSCFDYLFGSGTPATCYTIQGTLLISHLYNLFFPSMIFGVFYDRLHGKKLFQHQDSNPWSSDSKSPACTFAALAAFCVFLSNQGPQTSSHWPLEGWPNKEAASNRD